jgi:hypothetical protein
MPSRTGLNQRQQATSARRRRTLVLSLPRVQQLFDEALAGVPRARQAGRRQQLAGLLQAFVMAARPAGGIALGPDGRPLALARLLAEGARLAAEGEAAERLWAKLRRGQPMDQRLAEAVLLFFRHVLARPGLQLAELGAVEGERHAALRRLQQAVQAARDDVPAGILQAFVTRAEEAAQAPVALVDYVRRYEQLALSVDDDGVQRLRLTQVNRSRPVRLVPFAAVYPLRVAAEWYQWQRTPQIELRLWPLDAALRPGPERHVPLKKTLRDGLVWVEVDAQAAPDLVPGLPLQDDSGRDRLWQVEWRLRMVFNAADRDLLVSYLPLVQPEVQFEPAALALVEVSLGDSPGLQRTPAGWRLDRTLLPREVLAIRLRSRALTEADALRLAPTGEHRPGTAANEAAAD